ncbi:MAG: hypothetical protein HYU58_05465 [Proteobacteria bacterium]|nr:hypothetical protein [Pseudomonadota bacterium]
MTTNKKHITLQSLLVGATLVLASAAFVAMPVGNIAVAKNGGGNGGGHGNGGGNGGNAGGKSADHAANDSDHANGGQNHSNKNATPDDDDSPTASQLGKLNGFLHAAPEALNNASPNSSIGKISQVFHDLLNGFAEQQAPEGTAEDGTTEDPNEVTMDDLAGALADATNKTMSPEIVKEVLDRLTEVYGDDYSSLTDEDPNETPGETPGEGEEPAKSFAEDLSDRVNEINGFSSDSDDEADPS